MLMTCTDPVDVSVIIATYRGEPHLHRALNSLGAQTLPPKAFEILLVVNGPTGGVPAIIQEFRRRHPSHRVRTVYSSEAGASNARNIGLQSASGKFVTFMDDDDFVSPEYLAALRSAAVPGLVPVAFMVDVVDGADPSTMRLADSPNYFTAALLEHAGEIVPGEHAAPALSANVAKLVPREVARSIQYRTELASGEDFVYWTELFARTRFSFRVVDAASDAIYYRTVRQGSVSRQVPSYEFSVAQRLACVKALSLIDQDDPLVRKVVRGKVVAQVGHMNAYLKLHPQDRPQILRDIRSQDLAWFPYDALNRGTARDLAMLYCFTPYRDTSALVAARRIRDRGIPIDVISNRLDKLRESDEWSRQIAQEYIDGVLELSAPQAMGNWRCISAYATQAASAASEAQIVKGPYRSVYSRAMWPASHFAAALHKARYPDTSWIAEFSDPMLRDIHGDERPDEMTSDSVTDELTKAVEKAGWRPPTRMNLWEWSEVLAYALADEVVFTNANQREYMLSYNADPELTDRAMQVSRISHHPTLPREFYHQNPAEYHLEEGLRHIGYFGAFYATRALSEVIEALRQAGDHVRSRIRVHIFTGNVDQASAQIAAAGLEKIVTVREYLPFLQFLHMTTKFDVLLVNDAATARHHPINPYLPSKLSDYLGSGSPIWSVVEPGSALNQIATTYRSTLGDVDEAGVVLAQIANSEGPRSSRLRSGECGGT